MYLTMQIGGDKELFTTRTLKDGTVVLSIRPSRTAWSTLDIFATAEEVDQLIDELSSPSDEEKVGGTD
jgi:hypothetical protein